MPFDLKKTHQLTTFIEPGKAKIYHAVHKAANKTKWMRLSGVFVGAAVGLLTVSARLSRIAELVFKGSCDVLGCFFFKECELCRGLSRLTVYLIKELICLPFFILYAMGELLKNTVCMLFQPVEYSDKCLLFYDKAESGRREGEKEHQQKIQEQKEKKEYAQCVLEDLENNPNDVKTLKAAFKIYREGRGVEENDKQAGIYLQQAVDLGDAEAQCIMGVLKYKAGLYKDAIELLEKAADQNYLDALKFLIGVYVDEVQKNDKKAFEYAEKAAQLKDADAFYFLAVFYREGTGVEANEEKYLEYLEKAALKDHLLALQELCGYWFPKDKQKAINYRIRAANLGDVDSMNKVGAYLYTRGCYQDGFNYLMRAATNNHLESMYLVGLMSHTGDGVKKDVNTGLFWLRAAAKKGHKEAIGYLNKNSL